MQSTSTFASTPEPTLRSRLTGSDITVSTNRLRYREVVVIVPMGNYNQAQELGRYMHESIARNIVSTLALPEYKMFFLDTGEEVLVH